MNAQGTLIVIEGLDGSGKATQANILTESLAAEGARVRGITFPDYDSTSSALVKMYLAGEVGGVDEVNAYAATSFYACDRYISYSTAWREDYLSGVTIVADRYTTSNAIYQMAKLPKDQWEEYLSWTWDYEFERLGLPEPTRVLYLDVAPEVSQRLLLERYGGDPDKRDIHESNLDYLRRCREAALYAAKRLDWLVLDCCRNDEMRSIEEMAALIRYTLRDMLPTPEKE